jgi:hypothetical protein
MEKDGGMPATTSVAEGRKWIDQEVRYGDVIVWHFILIGFGCSRRLTRAFAAKGHTQAALA